MPDKYPALVKTITPTTGTSNYVLNTSASAGPYRNLDQAVADGSLSDGDTVQYVARDTTVTGDASFEAGEGVYDHTAKTITRTAALVWDGSSGPGVLVSWPGSGQRDIYLVSAHNSVIPRLDRSNTFADAIIVDTGATLAAQLSAQSSAAIARVTIQNNSTDAAAESQLHFKLTSNEPMDYPSGAVRSAKEQLWTGTASTRDAQLEFHCSVDDVLTELLRLSSAGLLTHVPTGDVYDHFPSGTELLFGTAPPTGWTRQNDASDYVVKTAQAAETPGNTAGVWGVSVTGSTAGHTLTTAQLPAHDHTPAGMGEVYCVSSGTGSFDVNKTTPGGFLDDDIAIQSVGSNQSHSHGSGSLSISSSWRPAHKIFARATKN